MYKSFRKLKKITDSNQKISWQKILHHENSISRSRFYPTFGTYLILDHPLQKDLIIIQIINIVIIVDHDIFLIYKSYNLAYSWFQRESKNKIEKQKNEK